MCKEKKKKKKLSTFGIYKCVVWTAKWCKVRNYTQNTKLQNSQQIIVKKYQLEILNHLIFWNILSIVVKLLHKFKERSLQISLSY